MDKLIAGFPKQLEEALNISKAYSFKSNDKNHSNIVLCGLGGSGIGGTIIQNYISGTAKIPFFVNKNYFLPEFVSKDSLVLICSYSGNTEETLHAFKQAIKKSATIICITSGGELERIAEEKNLDCIAIPGGFPPRACLGYSLVQILRCLCHFEIINDDYIYELKQSITLLAAKQEEIKKESKNIADQLIGKLPIIYAENNLEGVAIRWRQQINENGKQLCWHNIIPEMNHNELVGWRKVNDQLGVIFLSTNFDYDRNKFRAKINKEIISQYTSTVIDVAVNESSYLVNSLRLIHIGDWMSWFMSENNKVDAYEVNVIDFLKGELGKV